MLRIRNQLIGFRWRCRADDMGYFERFFVGQFEPLNLAVCMDDLFYVGTAADIDPRFNRFLMKLIDDRLPAPVEVEYALQRTLHLREYGTGKLMIRIMRIRGCSAQGVKDMTNHRIRNFPFCPFSQRCVSYFARSILVNRMTSSQESHFPDQVSSFDVSMLSALLPAWVQAHYSTSH